MIKTPKVINEIEPNKYPTTGANLGKHCTNDIHNIPKHIEIIIAKNTIHLNFNN
jgi:hypothetical protein